MSYDAYREIVNLLIPSGQAVQFTKSSTVDQPYVYDSEAVEKENTFSRIIRFFQTSNIPNEVLYKFIPAGNLAYKERLVLQFSLAKPYTTYFPLLRGLFGFGKIHNITISSNIQDKTLKVEISSDQTETILGYFETIFAELLKEVKFKSALKKVILAQREFSKIQKESLAGLYLSLS